MAHAALIGAQKKEGEMFDFDEDDSRAALMAVVDALLLVALAAEIGALAGVF